METDSAGVKATTHEKAVRGKVCRLPPISLTFKTNQIQLQKHLKNEVIDDFEFCSTRSGTRVITKGTSMTDFKALSPTSTITSHTTPSFSNHRRL
jgi:hypothetical protein